MVAALLAVVCLSSPASASRLEGVPIIGGGDGQVLTKLFVPRAAAASLSYADEVLADSPWGYYKLDEASGSNAADSSGNGRNATYVGGITYSSTPIITGSSKSVWMDGVDGTGVKVSSTQWMASANASVEGWFYPWDVSATGNGHWFWAETSGGRGSVGYGYTASGDLWVYGNVAGDKRNFFTGTISANTAYHIVITFSSFQLTSGVATLYVNGVADATTFTGQFSNGGEATIPFGFGLDHSAWGTATKGAVDDVAIYTSVLSATRVLAHYNARNTP